MTLNVIFDQLIDNMTKFKVSMLTVFWDKTKLKRWYNCEKKPKTVY